MNKARKKKLYMSHGMRLQTLIRNKRVSLAENEGVTNSDQDFAQQPCNRYLSILDQNPATFHDISRAKARGLYGTTN